MAEKCIEIGNHVFIHRKNLQVTMVSLILFRSIYSEARVPLQSSHMADLIEGLVCL